jgi:hypothetical protein
MKRTFTKGKQWKTIIILSILNFALSNGLSTWGVNTSVVGCYYKCNFPNLDRNYHFLEKLAKLAIAGLIIAFLGMRHFYST